MCNQDLIDLYLVYLTGILIVHIIAGFPHISSNELQIKGFSNLVLCVVDKLTVFLLYYTDCWTFVHVSSIHPELLIRGCSVSSLSRDSQTSLSSATSSSSSMGTPKGFQLRDIIFLALEPFSQLLMPEKPRCCFKLCPELPQLAHRNMYFFNAMITLVHH